MYMKILLCSKMLRDETDSYLKLTRGGGDNLSDDSLSARGGN